MTSSLKSGSSIRNQVLCTICQKKKKFDNCCCAYQVASVWKSILPENIRAHIAHLDCINDFDNVLRTADCIYNATKQNVPVAAVKPAAAKPSPSATGGAARELDTSADAPAFDQINQLTEQLAAFNKNFKKRPKPGRGGQTRGAQQTRGGTGKHQSRDQGGVTPTWTDPPTTPVECIGAGGVPPINVRTRTNVLGLISQLQGQNETPC